MSNPEVNYKLKVTVDDTTVEVVALNPQTLEQIFQQGIASIGGIKRARES